MVFLGPSRQMPAQYADQAMTVSFQILSKLLFITNKSLLFVENGLVTSELNRPAWDLIATTDKRTP
jgi:hypothetical protein